MKEKDFQAKFSKWVKYCFSGNAVFELKLARGESLPFSAVKDHQVSALLAAKKNAIVYKIPDIGFQNPFDCLRMENVGAYVVIMYDVSRITFHMIDVEIWVKEKETSPRKSLTWSRCCQIGKEFSLKSNPPHQPSL